MTTSNQYNVQKVDLTGGLDYVAPKITANPGTLLDCYNFEVADRLGYKRIDGIEPFDGHTSPSLAYTNVVFITYSLASGAGDPTVGSQAVVQEAASVLAGDPLKIFGVVCKVYNLSNPARTVVAVAVTDYQIYYQLANGVVFSDNTGTSDWTVDNISSIEELSTEASYDTVTEQYDEYVDLYNQLDEEVTCTPAGTYNSLGDLTSTINYSPPTGGQWYKDRLYITQDLDQIYFTNLQTNVPLYNGDILDNGSNSQYVVRDYKVFPDLTSGTTQQGTILVTFGDSLVHVGTSPTSYNIVRNGSNVGTITLKRASVASSAYATRAWLGGIWRSTNFVQGNNASSNEGWQAVESGYVFSYKNGQAYGSPASPPQKIGREVAPTTTTVITSTSAVAFTAASTTGWTLTGGPATNVEAIATADTKYITKAIVGSGLTAPITFTAPVTSAIPDDALILGIKVVIRAQRDRVAPVGTPPNVGLQVTLIAPGSQTKQLGLLTNAFVDYEYGGSADLWGTALSVADVKDSGFGISIQVQSAAGTGTRTVDIDLASIEIYYQNTVSQLFFWDGTDDVTATIVNWNIDDPTSSEWASGTAAGQMHVINVLPYLTAARQSIKAGDQIRTAAGGLGVKVADVDTGMVFAGVPSFTAMLEKKSRTQAIVANFYGNDDWEAIYAANGAGRAWTYDGYYFRYIYTGLPISKDLPRHVAFNFHHLALGYSAGEVAMSVEGEPENFSGTDGAVAIDVGDRITGLLKFNGDTLAVYCESSTIGIQGTSIDDFTTLVLSPNEGAIEYTVVDMGRPIHCSHRGISTFDQTAAYGDFLGSRLSQQITPWLIPRLQGTAPPLAFNVKRGAAISQKPVFAMAVRAKNQYKLWFQDGYVLTMTLNSSGPMFTTQRLYDGKTAYDTGVPLIPFWVSNAVDSSGVDRIHFADYSPTQQTTYKKFCYELDKGWLFRDGSSDNKIGGYIALNHSFYDLATEFKCLRRVRLHGLSKGKGQYQMTAKNDYSTSYAATTSPEYQPISFPRDAVIGDTGVGDYMPVTDCLDITKEGLSLTLKIIEKDVKQPPVVLQTMLLQFMRTKGDF